MKRVIIGGLAGCTAGGLAVGVMHHGPSTSEKDPAAESTEQYKDPEFDPRSGAVGAALIISLTCVGIGVAWGEKDRSLISGQSTTVPAEQRPHILQNM